MFTNDFLDTVVCERGERLRAEALAERCRGSAPARRALAASLRRIADRLDGAALNLPAEPARR